MRLVSAKLPVKFQLDCSLNIYRIVIQLGGIVRLVQSGTARKKTVGTACVHDTRSSRPDSHPNCHNSLIIYRIVVNLGQNVCLVSANLPVKFQLDCSKIKEVID